MPKYIVRVQQLWTQDVEIEAKNEEEARELVEKGNGEETGELTYVWTEDNSEDWVVKEL